METIRAPEGDPEDGLTVAGGMESTRGPEPQIQDLNREIAALRERLTRLSEATLRISDDPDIAEVLHQIISGARSVTGARYGVLLSYDESGQVESVAASGLTDDEIQQVSNQPAGLGLLGCLNEAREPVRIADIASHPSSAGFPANHPPMKTFLGMQIRSQDHRLGTIFLTDKQGGVEFTSEDEETLVMFASHAARAISNARRFREVQRAKADLEALFDLSPVGIMAFELTEGRIVSYNQEILRMFGDRSIVESPWEEMLPLVSFRRFDGREIPAAEWPMVRIYQFGETIRAEEIIIQMPDGRPVPVLVNAAPIYSEQGEITQALFALQDMSSLADAERVRSEFLGLVSEELRMPLTTIKGSVAALLGLESISGQTEPQQLLRIIDQQTDLMRGQVNGLVELTRISTGTLLITQEAIAVADLLDSAFSEYRSSHGRSAVQVNVPDDLPLVMADRQRIGQVLINLLVSVARHATHTSRIRVTVSLIDIYVAVSVSSGGPGSAMVDESQLETSQQLLERILGPQIGDVRKFAGGESLALGMCKGIVEAHGGRMRVENDNRLGAMTITFTLPTADEAPEDEVEDFIPDVSHHPGAGGAAEREAARLLLAIDDPRAVALARQTLSGAGYALISCSRLDDMGPIIEQEKPHLVLLDLSAYSAGGFQAIRHLSDGYGIPTVVLSGQADDEIIGRAFEMGADDYIVKPFSPTELLARIKSALRRQTAHLAPAEVINGYSVGDVSVNYDARTLTVSGSQVPLTATEYKLLHELSRNAGRILTQDELLHRVWGPEYIGEPQLLRSYIKSLRQKLRDNARSPTYIFTEHGIGYRMAKP